MWNRMTEGWVWIVAVIDLAVSIGVAQLLVHFGVRWSYMMEQPLDASNSVLGFTMLFGLLLPIVALMVSPMITCRSSGSPEQK